MYKVYLCLIAFCTSLLLYSQDDIKISYKGRTFDFKHHRISPKEYPNLVGSIGFELSKKPFTSIILMKSLNLDLDLFNRVNINAYFFNPIISELDIDNKSAKEYSYSSNDFRGIKEYGIGTKIHLLNINRPANLKVLLGRTIVDDKPVKLATYIKSSRSISLSVIGNVFSENATIKHNGNSLYDGVYSVVSHVNYDQSLYSAGLEFSLKNCFEGEMVHLKSVENIRKIEVYIKYIGIISNNLEDIIIAEDFWLSNFSVGDNGSFIYNPADDEEVLAGEYPLSDGVDYKINSNGFVFGLRFQDLKYNDFGYTVESTIGTYPGYILQGERNLVYSLKLGVSLGR